MRINSALVVGGVSRRRWPSVRPAESGSGEPSYSTLSAGCYNTLSRTLLQHIIPRLLADANKLGLGCRRRLQTPMAERETCGIGFWRTLLQHIIRRLLQHFIRRLLQHIIPRLLADAGYPYELT